MGFNENWAIKLTAMMAGIFFLQMLFPVVTDLFVLDATNILYRPWTIVTSIFLHADLTHILFNGFALVLFGSILENIIGSRKFLIYFFVTGIAASIVFILGIPIIQAVQGESATAALGASGAIFGVMGILAVLRPNMIIYLGFFPVPMWLAAIIWAGQDFLGIFIPDNIANFAHLGGLFLGIIIGLSLTGGKIEIGRKKSSANVLSEEEISSWERERL
ncbi:MAG TPA: rhomboid family intramembrane serine protease [Candidatus Diapherotrites archaeon]|uniref:Rhomboid family intramembrane serine protease n=1 Tax=Candidatus Iainarchaeum sp. TaxID=3101447 RepID=A0A7J4IYJ0_9ARCH|nr:rhomboid family intramembrane serine protease [Candidatus Diapherotrites archaeon]